MALTNGLWNDGPIDSLIDSWNSWPTGYVVEYGGPVIPLAVTPGSQAAAPKMSAAASTATGFTTASQTVTTTFTPDRFTNASFATSRIAIKLQGPAGFVASNYLPTLSGSGATRENSNPLGDYSWATNPGSTSSINFSFVSLPQGRYTMTVIAQDSFGTVLNSNPMSFDVFVKVPTVTATTVPGKIDSVALSWMAHHRRQVSPPTLLNTVKMAATGRHLLAQTQLRPLQLSQGSRQEPHTHSASHQASVALSLQLLRLPQIRQSQTSRKSLMLLPLHHRQTSQM